MWFCHIGNCHLRFDHFLFITCPDPSFIPIFYRRPLHLYNPAMSCFHSYRPFFFPSRSSYLPRIHFYSTSRSTSSASHPRSPSSRYSRSCFQLIWMHGIPSRIRKAFTGEQHVGHQKLRFISLIQSISVCLEMHDLWGAVS